MLNFNTHMTSSECATIVDVSSNLYFNYNRVTLMCQLLNDQKNKNIFTYCPLRMLTQRMKEKRSLSFSNRDRHTFLYILLVKWSFKLKILSSSSSDGWLFIIDQNRTVTVELLFQDKEVFEACLMYNCLFIHA